MPTKIIFKEKIFEFYSQKSTLEFTRDSFLKQKLSLVH